MSKGAACEDSIWHAVVESGPPGNSPEESRKSRLPPKMPPSQDVTFCVKFMWRKPVETVSGSRTLEVTSQLHTDAHAHTHIRFPGLRT